MKGAELVERAADAAHRWVDDLADAAVADPVTAELVGDVLEALRDVTLYARERLQEPLARALGSLAPMGLRLLQGGR